jgi:unspecific peroxygenase
VDGRNQSGALDLKSARGFFQRGQFPTGFHRRNGSFGLNEIGPDVDAVAEAHPIAPGHNEGVGNYVLNPEDPGLSDGVRSFSDY